MDQFHYLLITSRMLGLDKGLRLLPSVRGFEKYKDVAPIIYYSLWALRCFNCLLSFSHRFSMWSCEWEAFRGWTFWLYSKDQSWLKHLVLVWLRHKSRWKRGLDLVNSSRLIPTLNYGSIMFNMLDNVKRTLLYIILSLILYFSPL